MLRRAIPYLIFLCSCLPFAGAGQNPLARETVKTYTPQQLQADLDILVQTLQTVHPGFYSYTSREKWEKIISRTRKRLDHDMTIIEYRNILAPLIYETHCDHTSIEYDSAQYRYFIKQQPRFPFRVKIFHNRMYVWQNLSRDSMIPAGTEILAINGMKVRKLLKKLLYTESADGYNKTKLHWSLAMDFYEKYSIFIGPASEFDCVFRFPGCARTCRHVVKGITRDSSLFYFKIRYPEVWKLRNMPLRFTIDKTNNTGIMTITHFRFEPGDVVFNRFLDSAVQEMNVKGIGNLVLDLRDNNGGQGAAGKEVFAHLNYAWFKYFDGLEECCRKRFTNAQYTDLDTGYYRKWHYDSLPGGTWSVSNQPLLLLQRQAQNVYTGNLIVLVNGGSMSATAILADIIHANHRGIFIGDEAGGGYSACNGNAVNMTLPNTHLSISLPLRRFYFSVGPNTFPRQCLVPEIRAAERYSDFKKGRDRAMEYACKIIKLRTWWQKHFHHDHFIGE